MAKITSGEVDLIRDDLDSEEVAYVVRMNRDGEISLDLGRVILRYGQWQVRDASGLNKKTVDTVADGLQHLLDVYNASQ